MAYETRTKDDAGDPGRYADQNQAVDNEEYLKGLVDALAPDTGVLIAYISVDGMVDNTLTDLFSITTTNETGDADAGGYFCVVEGVFIHNVDEDDHTSGWGCDLRFTHVNGADGSADTPDSDLDINKYDEKARSGDPENTVFTDSTYSINHASNYETEVKVTVNLGGTVIGTGSFRGLVKVLWWGYLTAPEIVPA